MACCGNGGGTNTCCKQVVCATPCPPCAACYPGVPPTNVFDSCCPDLGCPRGFKPCVMTLTPPAGADPRGIWIATVEKCPPKQRGGGGYGGLGADCGRSGDGDDACDSECDEDGEGGGKNSEDQLVEVSGKDHKCIYPLPCKADCFDTPVEMRAVHFY